MAEYPKVPAAALAGVDRPDLNPLSISRFGTWAKCSALGYLRYVLKADTDYTAPHFVVGSVIHSALEAYYKGEVDDPMQGADKALRKFFEEHGQEGAYARCCEVAEAESTIISKFERGEITKKDGSLYTAPRMTTAYKALAREAGLDQKIASLEGVVLGKVKLPEGGIVELVARVKSLIQRYQRTIMVPREHFETIFVESKFDFVDLTPEGEEVRWLGFMDLVGKLKPEHGGKWLLIDYKSGRAQSPDDHQVAADSSLQLTLYEHVLTKLWNIPREELVTGLHFLDAAFAAETERSDRHYQGLLSMVGVYRSIVGKPGLVKRIFYDDKNCQSCEHRSACVRTFGHGCSTTPKSVPMPAPSTTGEGRLEDIWD